LDTLLRLNIRDERGDGRLNPALVERLLAELRSVGEAPIVTLESDTEAFCEGLDLSALAAGDVDPTAAIGRFADLLDTMEAAPRPIIALVNGPARGGGVGLAAAADFVLAAPHATFGLPEAIFGLIPAMVFPVLARRVGHARARWLALSAVTLTAREAWRLGLVDEVADDLETALRRHVHRLQRLDLRALGAVKSIAVAHVAAPADYRGYATARFQQLVASPETRERIRRFLAGETPWPEGE
jgi:enoyl-CoA hydratase/carnithine racemase